MLYAPACNGVIYAHRPWALPANRCTKPPEPPRTPRRDASCCSSNATVHTQQSAFKNAPCLRNPRGLLLHPSAGNGVAHIHAMSTPCSQMHTCQAKAPKRDAAVGSSTAMVPYIHTLSQSLSASFVHTNGRSNVHPARRYHNAGAVTLPPFNPPHKVHQ